MEDKPVTMPNFKWEWNINTLAVLLGFGAGLMAWGYAWGQVQEMIPKLVVVEGRVGNLERTLSQLDNFSYRISQNESKNAENDRQLETVIDKLNEQSSDIKVVREILQRLERERAAATRDGPNQH